MSLPSCKDKAIINVILSIKRKLTFCDSKLLSLADDDRFRLSAEPVDVITLDIRVAETGEFGPGLSAAAAILRGINVTFAAPVVEVLLLSAASEFRLTRWFRICWAVEAAALGAGLSAGSSAISSWLSPPVLPFSSLITTMSPFSTSSEL